MESMKRFEGLTIQEFARDIDLYERLENGHLITASDADDKASECHEIAMGLRRLLDHQLSVAPTGLKSITIPATPNIDLRVVRAANALGRRLKKMLAEIIRLAKSEEGK